MRTVQRISMLAAAAVVCSCLAACGSDPPWEDDAPVEYELICQQRRDCMSSGDFSEQYGSIDECAEEIDTSMSQRTPTCADARRTELGCFMQNFQCENGTPQPSDACNFVTQARQTACGDDDNNNDDEPEIADTQDFETYCSLRKDCMGESAFEDSFVGMDECVSYYEDLFGSTDQICLELLSTAFLCEIENFTCENERRVTPEACEDAWNELDRECSS